MPRKQMITVTCPYRRYNQDLTHGLPECFPPRSPPRNQQEDYMVHGLPKRLHCRPRVPVTPSKLGENYFWCGKSPRMVNGIQNVLKMYGTSQDNPAWPELKMKLEYAPERNETKVPFEAMARESNSVYKSEAANVANCNLEFEIRKDEAQTTCCQNLVQESNACEYLGEDTARNQTADACDERERRDGLTAKNITPPNSPNPELKVIEPLLETMEENVEEKEKLNNEIYIIDESVINEEEDVSDEEPASWYHKLVQLELQNKTLQVPKPMCISAEHKFKSQLPNVCKCHVPSSHFPPYDSSESRRISRTERHVQYLILKENSIKTREKSKRQSLQKPRKPAV